jgi:hypothetical protein
LTTENHYFYLFLLIIRLGIYLIPFFLVFFTTGVVSLTDQL